MLVQTYPIWERDEYTYDKEIDFIPSITVYVLEGNEKRPAVVIAPGGSYAFLSPAEGEMIAMRFLNAGINAFIVNSTVNPLGVRQPIGKQALRDISRAMVMIRENSDTWRTDPNKIAVCGFSAGGHLAASLGVHWCKDFLQDIKGIDRYSNEPNALILCYPVIISADYAHKGSIHNLLGKEAAAKDLEEMSLEKQVSIKTPPTFLWHTYEDDVVPVENSLAFAMALRKNNVPFEMHIYPKGHHGYSLADHEYANYTFDGKATSMEQVRKTVEYELAIGAITLGNIDISSIKSWEEFSEKILTGPKSTPNLHIASWMGLCIEWLNGVFAG